MYKIPCLVFYFIKNSVKNTWLAFSINTRNDNLYLKLAKQTSKVLSSILSISLDGKRPKSKERNLAQEKVLGLVSKSAIKYLFM